jgi:molecular chaperone DnaJ
VPPATDYYQTLGVSRDASPDDIKKAFRGRARDVHPDTSDREDAEERFKELNEAYEVLSDPEKRATYDRFGTSDPREAGYGGGGFEDLFSGGGVGMGDVFSMFFDGVMNGGARTVRREGRDMGGQVTLTLLEAADGAVKQVRYTRAAPCGTCGGSGAAAGGSLQTCPDCSGSGQVATVRRTLLGSFQSLHPCARCGATGSIVDPPCPTCAGQGRANKTETVDVTVQPGLLDGARLRVPSMGEAGLRGAAAGDLIVTVRIKAHDFLHREGDDLHARANVPMTVAALGGDLTVSGLRGNVTVQVPAATQNGVTLVVKGEGMPRTRGAGTGDLVVHANIVVPKRLSKDQRALLEQLAATMGEHTAPSKLDRIRDWLGV